MTDEMKMGIESPPAKVECVTALPPAAGNPVPAPVDAARAVPSEAPGKTGTAEEGRPAAEKVLPVETGGAK